MTLEGFLAQARRAPFVWGQFDCSLWLADWLVANGRPDPGRDLRGAYTDEAGAARILEAAGGLARLLGAMAAKAGLKAIQGPRRGDLGVVEVLTRRGVAPAGAICTGPRWAVLSEQGVLTARLHHIAAWSL